MPPVHTKCSFKKIIVIIVTNSTESTFLERENTVVLPDFIWQIYMATDINCLKIHNKSNSNTQDGDQLGGLPDIHKQSNSLCYL